MARNKSEKALPELPPGWKWTAPSKGLHLRRFRILNTNGATCEGMTALMVARSAWRDSGMTADWRCNHG